jgi:putative tryptophan/tyrosine transport system substrate-binding protein
MRRREFIAGLGGAATGIWPFGARAQQPVPRMRRIGILSSFDDNNPTMRSQVMEMFQALSRLGWESGRNVQIVQHWTAGNVDRTGMLAKELVASQPDVIVAAGTPAAAAMQRETRTIPIVFTVVTDPVGAGLVAGLSRPGGNITGLSNSEEAFGGKLLSLVMKIAPRIKRAAVMFNPDTAPGHGLYHLGAFETAARSLGLEPITARVHSDADIEQVIVSLGREQGGLVAIPDVFVNTHRGTVIEASLRVGVPTIFDGTGFAKEGGLLQYGPDFWEMYRRTALFVDRILRGAKPSDLPVELPTKYGLVINLKTAKALGLNVSSDMLSIADEVIE